MLKSLFSVYCLILFLFPIVLHSETISEQQKTSIGINSISNVTNLKESQIVQSLLTTIEIIETENKDSSEIDDINSNEPNFYFSSGPNFISDNRLSKDAVLIFSKEFQNQLFSLDTNGNVCWIQGFVQANNQRMVVAVHNSSESQPEDVYKCLTAALWEFRFESLDGLDVEDWRKSFRQLF